MFGRPSSKEKDKLALVFDIGSSSVGGALFFMQKSGIPKIILSIREPIIAEEKIDADKFLLLTLQALQVVASKVSKAGVGAPYKIFCVLSSPWHVSQTRIINFKKNTPFVFTEKLADDLIQKEITIFEEENSAKYVHPGGMVRSIEFKNIKILLNGYETSQPLNQKAKELEMVIFISISPEMVLNKITRAINKHFHFEDIKFYSFLFSSFTVVRDLFPNQKDFLLVDIGGELTDVSIIKEDILQESISYPLGLNFIIRRVASELNSSLPEARAFLSLYKDGHASSAVQKKIEPIIKKLETEWLHKFQTSLADLSRGISVPSTIYMTVDKDLTYFFSELIKNEQFNQYSRTVSKFQVIPLGTEVLHGLASFESHIERDPSLISESVYINRYLRHIK